jgi:predicted nucleotide-binding protein
LITENFKPDSSQSKSVIKAMRIHTEGNGEPEFIEKIELLMGSLYSAKVALEDDTFGEIGHTARAKSPAYSNKIFVVHGHDHALKAECEVLLTNIGLTPIVLHREPDQGRTIIEKIEQHSDVGYAIILMTPDEISYLANEKAKPESERKLENRSRPNVIFEFGYFVGKLGRNRVCCVVKDSTSRPSDIDGLIYKDASGGMDSAAFGIIKELKAAGYSVTL